MFRRFRFSCFTFPTSEFQCFLGKGFWIILGKVLGWILEALGGQERQKVDEECDSDGDGGVMVVGVTMGTKRE